MEGETLRAGKERVRENLILPLTKGGMIRKRGMSKTAEDEMLTNLEARLAYMTADNLKALAEVLERYAGGKHKNVWPAEVSIYNWARAIQFPPASESRLVRSYLQSAAGSAAEVGGYLVELFWYLKKFGAPPNTYSLSEIKREADDNRSALARIRRAQEVGRASQSELNWVEYYYRTQRRCLDVINAKREGIAA
ncbi:MAG: hypothetical protein ACPGNV_14195 [Mangrovicoccus sp.]